MKLHLGCGPVIHPGWFNVDNVAYPGVDQVLDVTQGLPFSDVDFVFAEHFIEHLPYPEAVKLLTECRRILGPNGVLRLSTPNLDWVWTTHYRLGMNEEEAISACFQINRAFHGWGHHFLYNEQSLRATLQEAGFASALRVEYGESNHPELRGLERHEKSPDWGSLSHILIIEASGTGGRFPAHAKAIRSDFLRDVALR